MSKKRTAGELVGVIDKAKDELQIQVCNKIKEFGIKAAAEKLGCNKSYVCRIASGKQILSAHKLSQMSEKLGMIEQS